MNECTTEFEFSQNYNCLQNWQIQVLHQSRRKQAHNLNSTLKQCHSIIYILFQHWNHVFCVCCNQHLKWIHYIKIYDGFTINFESNKSYLIFYNVDLMFSKHVKKKPRTFYTRGSFSSTSPGAGALKTKNYY